MEIKRLLYFFIICTSMSSCLKDEIPVPVPQPGNVDEAQVGMGNDYRYQIYFNLDRGENVGQNIKTDWDLGFECSEGWHVILNSSKLMRCALTNDLDFKNLIDTAGLDWNFDGITGHLDSTAMGDWRASNFLYVIDRGVDERGMHQGFVKLFIEDYNESMFTIQFAELLSGDPKRMNIIKKPGINFTSLSFENGGEQIELEPLRRDWDLLFTQYSEYLFDGTSYLPYLVTGVEINRFQTMAVLVNDKAFEEISLDDVGDYVLDSRINQPGYNWKYFDFDNQVYTIVPENIYVIQTSSGLYYKLRFIDFYNDSGEKGYPKFEYQRL